MSDRVEIFSCTSKHIFSEACSLMQNFSSCRPITTRLTTQNDAATAYRCIRLAGGGEDIAAKQEAELPTLSAVEQSGLNITKPSN